MFLTQRPFEFANSCPQTSGFLGRTWRRWERPVEEIWGKYISSEDNSLWNLKLIYRPDPIPELQIRSASSLWLVAQMLPKVILSQIAPAKSDGYGARHLFVPFGGQEKETAKDYPAILLDWWMRTWVVCSAWCDCKGPESLAAAQCRAGETAAAWERRGRWAVGLEYFPWEKRLMDSCNYTKVAWSLEQNSRFLFPICTFWEKSMFFAGG